MYIEITNKIDYSEYEDFLKKENEATFYHSYKHLEFLKDVIKSNPLFVVVYENKLLKGVLPFFEKKSEFGIVINSLPFFGSYGGFVSSDFLVQKKILEKLNEYNHENDILSSVIIVSPFTKYCNMYEKYYNYNQKENRRIQCVILNNDVDVVWNSFEQRVRRSVRKATKNNVTVEKVIPDKEGMKNFYALHKEEMEKKNGRVKPAEFFKHLSESFIPHEQYDIFCAKKDTTDIAYLLVFYFNQFTEYYMPAYDSNFKHLQATSLLIWESLKTSIQKNIQYYNFGGTWQNQPELYLYKRGWAADEYSYNYYIFGDIERARHIGLTNIKKNFENFYVFSYDKISNFNI